MNIQFCKLKNPKHVLPMPDRGGRRFSAKGENVDIEHPFWRACLAQNDIEIHQGVQADRPDDVADEGQGKEDAKAPAVSTGGKADSAPSPKKEKAK